MKIRTTLFLFLILIISSESFYSQYLERYDSFNINRKSDVTLKLGIKTIKEIEKHISAKSPDIVFFVRKYFCDTKGNLTRYEFYKDTLEQPASSGWDYIIDENKNTLEVFNKGKLTAKRMYDDELNTTLEININGDIIDTVEHNAYTYININGEKLLTSITSLLNNPEIENCTKYIFDYDSLGRMIHRRDYWPNGILSMENIWNYDSLICYTSSFRSDGESGSKYSFTINEQGKPVEIKNYFPPMNMEETTVYEYNKEGKLILENSCVGNNCYKGLINYDNNGNILENKLFKNETLQSCVTYNYFNNGLLQQRVSEDFSVGKTITISYIYEFY